MEAIKITIIPNIKRSDSVAVRIAPNTYKRLLELSDQMEMSVCRVTDYLLNVALDNVELTVLGEEEK